MLKRSEGWSESLSTAVFSDLESFFDPDPSQGDEEEQCREKSDEEKVPVFGRVAQRNDRDAHHAVDQPAQEKIDRKGNTGQGQHVIFQGIGQSGKKHEQETEGESFARWDLGNSESPFFSKFLDPGPEDGSGQEIAHQKVQGQACEHEHISLDSPEFDAENNEKEADRKSDNGQNRIQG